VAGRHTPSWTSVDKLDRYMEEHKKLPQPPEGTRFAMYK